MADYARGGIEPPLREMLADPVVHAVMRRDRVQHHESRVVLALAQERLQRREPQLCAWQGWRAWSIGLAAPSSAAEEPERARSKRERVSALLARS